MQELEKLQNLIAEYGFRSRSCALHPNSDTLYNEKKQAELELEKEIVYILKERDELHNQVISLQHRLTEVEEEVSLNNKTIESLKQLLQEMHGFVTNG